MFEQVIDILVQRDGMTRTEAIDLCETVADQVAEKIGDPDDYYQIEELLADELGLEMDYIMEFLPW